MATPRERRLTTAIIVATLALSALFLAQGATRVLAAEIFGGPADDAPKPRRRVAASQPEFMRKRDPKVLLDGNLFDPARLTMPEPIPGAGPGSGPGPDWNPGEPAPECNSKLRLVGSVVSPSSPDWSFAAITGSEGKTMLYRKGNSVDGSYVLAVRAASVVVQPSGGSVCELAMFTEEQPPARVPSVREKAAADKDSSRVNKRNAGLSTEELEQGIQKISDTKFKIERSLVDKVLANQGAIMKTARVIPHEENGRVVGVKLYGIRRTSLLGKLGIRNGDMLRTINGFDMTSPDSALEAYSRLRTADALSLAVKRQNKEVTIEYDIQ